MRLAQRNASPEQRDPAAAHYSTTKLTRKTKLYKKRVLFIKSLDHCRHGAWQLVKAALKLAGAVSAPDERNSPCLASQQRAPRLAENSMSMVFGPMRGKRTDSTEVPMGVTSPHPVTTTRRILRSHAIRNQGQTRVLRVCAAASGSAVMAKVVASAGLAPPDEKESAVVPAKFYFSSDVNRLVQVRMYVLRLPPPHGLTLLQRGGRWAPYPAPRLRGA